MISQNPPSLASLDLFKANAWAPAADNQEQFANVSFYGSFCFLMSLGPNGLMDFTLICFLLPLMLLYSS
jgi:hypothetical protein